MTYKAGLEWAPSPDLRLRASFNHAVRAPNVVELFTPPTLAAALAMIPCAGAIRSSTRWIHSQPRPTALALGSPPPNTAISDQ